MALVRVYCGLAAVESRDQPATSGSALTAALVDDAGRVLDVCDIQDHPKGYAYLSSLLAERASGPYSVAIAADHERQLVPQLLAAAGWAMAFTDDGTTDDFAERFADELTEDGGTGRRRALGLARALQAGALTATTIPAPSELVDLKPVLAADNALATGRYGAAIALREVLRELYPAALRAYPDPADPVALAVMDALPEPGMLAASPAVRGRDAAAADAVTAQLTATGVADPATIAEAITALRVAIAETPRRGGLSRALAATIADTVRQSVAAVRACDAARATLINTLAERVPTPTPTPVAVAPAPVPRPEPVPVPPRPQPVPVSRPPAIVRPAVPVPPANIPPANIPPAPVPPAPVPLAPVPAVAVSQPPAIVPPVAVGQPPPQPASPVSAGPAVAAGVTASRPMSTPAHQQPASRPMSTPPHQQPASRPMSTPAHQQPASRPVSAPPPPPGITPIADPLPQRARPAVEPSRAAVGAHSTESEVRVPLPRPAPEGPPPGSRSAWPTHPPADDWATSLAPPPRPAPPRPAPPRAAPPRPTPPWLADDLKPPEPPPLRLVEPTLPAELRDEFGPNGWPEQPPLRLVDLDEGIPRSAPPVDADAGDDDLLIFAQACSAWFTGDGDDQTWNSAMDVGWRAAEQATRPAVGEHTPAGLPRRVPHANLIPGSPPSEQDRPLRVVRDPASIAAHTSGYFKGWRRGQEVGGYPLGTRATRPAAGAWDFARDDRLSG